MAGSVLAGIHIIMAGGVLADTGMVTVMVITGVIIMRIATDTDMDMPLAEEQDM